MKAQLGLPGLVIGPCAPVRLALNVFPGRHPAGTGSDAVQDRPVERRVDDFVVGHEPLPFNIPNLNARPVYGYGAKPEIMQ